MICSHLAVFFICVQIKIRLAQTDRPNLEILIFGKFINRLALYAVIQINLVVVLLVRLFTNF